MRRFAFYGRVSTEDQQDPASSKGWQIDRARALVEPAGGEIVVQFFDLGVSRSLPLERRPEAQRMLQEMARHDRCFDAVVIGEPQRAFYGNQFGLTFPVLVHYGVELGVPEVGGRVDPGSEAHDLVMSLYGGMSKGERNRIKMRVRSSMASQAVSEGRFLGGRPPYGYQLVDAGPHPNPGKARIGQRLHRLEPDPVTAPIVRRIFEHYVHEGVGVRAIAERLTADGIPSPAAYDPARNPHRQASGSQWNKSAIKVIIENRRYTGHETWGKQGRREVLLNVRDVAAGYATKMAWNPEATWLRSAERVNEPLVDDALFEAAQAHRNAGAGRPTVRRPRSSPRPYLLAGRVHCAACHRRMQGQWLRDSPLYRCRAEAPSSRTDDHPRNSYVREDRILPALDRWVARMFDPDNLDDTVAALAAVADAPDEAAQARAESARATIADCDMKLRRFKKLAASMEDPTLVGQWMAEEQTRRMMAIRELGEAIPQPPPDEAELRALVLAMGSIAARLATADPALRRKVYVELGVHVHYAPGAHRITIEASSAVGVSSVGGGT